MQLTLTDRQIAKYMLKEFGYSVQELNSVHRLTTIENRLRSNLVNKRIFGHEINAANQSLLAINKRKMELMGTEERPAKALGISDLSHNGQAMEQEYARKDLIERAEALEKSDNQWDKDLAKRYREVIVTVDTQIADLNERVNAQRPIDPETNEPLTAEQIHMKHQQVHKPKGLAQKMQEHRAQKQQMYDELDQ